LAIGGALFLNLCKMKADESGDTNPRYDPPSVALWQDTIQTKHHAGETTMTAKCDRRREGADQQITRDDACSDEGPRYEL